MANDNNWITNPATAVAPETRSSTAVDPAAYSNTFSDQDRAAIDAASRAAALVPAAAPGRGVVTAAADSTPTVISGGRVVSGPSNGWGGGGGGGGGPQTEYRGAPMATYTGPTAAQITAGMPVDPRAPANMNYLLGLKYFVAEKQAEGQFQENIANAYKGGEEGSQVASNAASLRALQAAQAGEATQRGTYFGEAAKTEAVDRTASEPFLRGAHGPLARGHYLDDMGGDVGDGLHVTGNGIQVINPAPTYETPAAAAPAPTPVAPAPTSEGQPAAAKPIGPQSSLEWDNRPTRGTALAANWDYGTAGARPRSTSSSPLDDLLASINPMRARKGTADVQPLRKGSANVKAAKSAKAPKGGNGKPAKGGGAPPAGLEQILPLLMQAAQGPGAGPGAGAAGPGAADAMPPPEAPGAGAPPGFARGARNVLPNPGYPFGAGYLFGATAVPGRGSGTVDTVPAMLAPHEAVLNKAAADTLGRSRIAALNAKGARQMGMSRGAPGARAS